MALEFKTVVILAAGAIVASGAVAWFLRSDGEAMSPSGELRVPRVVGATSERGKASERAPRKGAGGRLRGNVRNAGGKTERERPDFSVADEDDEVLTSPQFRALLAEIRAAYDANSRHRIVNVVRRMQQSSEWPDGIPSSLHKAAINALMWFGGSVAPELLGYLGASDAEVVSDATDAIMDAISDFSISDHERSALMLGCVKMIKDADTLDTMIMELGNMRPTVRAKTGIGIANSGNTVAVEVLGENLEFYFDDFDALEVSKPGDLQAYLKMAEKAYADDPELAEWDESLYGGDKGD